MGDTRPPAERERVSDDGGGPPAGSAGADRRRPTGATGPLVERLETAVTDALDVDHAVCVRTGTRALRVALRAAGIGSGDEVFVPAFAPRTTLGAVLAVGARPVVVDVNPVTYTIASFDLEAAVEEATAPAGIVPVHARGQPAEMHHVRNVARANGLAVVEDARDALGAAYRGHPAGTLADAGCFRVPGDADFAGPEPLGIVVTDDERVARSVRVRRAAGATADERRGRAAFDDRESRAAAGLTALRDLDSRVARRRRLARQYARLLADLDDVRLPQPRRDTDHAFTGYVIAVPDRDALATRLAATGVDAAPAYPLLAHQYPDVAGSPTTVHGARIATDLASRLVAMPVAAEVDERDVRDASATIAAHYA